MSPRGDAQPVVANLCWLGLKDTRQVGRVDKDDNSKDDNLGDKDIHSGMDGKPPTEKATNLDFFFGEECNFGFLLERKTKNKKLFLMLFSRQKKTILCIDLMESMRT